MVARFYWKNRRICRKTVAIWRQVLISVWIVKGFIVFIVFLLFQLLKFLLFKVLLFHLLKSWENTTICTLDRKPYKVSYFLILWAIINYKMVVINCDRLFEIWQILYTNVVIMFQWYMGIVTKISNGQRRHLLGYYNMKVAFHPGFF